ncbi:MAG: ferritin-like domain-containing protein [Cytophagales bacterium]|nr:ferritin-like domain-containing protein [Cytophagales bacterium]
MSTKAKNLEELFEDGLKDIYWAEKKLVKSLPEMEEKATNEKLKKSLKDHLKETEKQVERLEEVFKSIDKKPTAKKCEAMAGLIEEGEEIIEETESGDVRDAGIIMACQKVEHYEIASYGTLAAFAKVLGYKKAVKLLLETLEEEKNADEHLSEIADTALNTEAIS